MKISFSLLTLIAFGFLPAARAFTLYNNTTTDTFDTVFYSSGPYLSLGDQIQLTSAGTASGANVELYNNGTAGTFNAELDFFTVGSPVGSLLGSYVLTGNASVGSDVLDLSFDLGAGLAVPQDLIFTLTLSNATSGMDLGLDMFEAPTIGSSDNTFMIASASLPTYVQLLTNSENVYFQLNGEASDASAPEPSSAMILGVGLLILGAIRVRTLRHRG